MVVRKLHLLKTGECQVKKSFGRLKWKGQSKDCFTGLAIDPSSPTANFWQSTMAQAYSMNTPRNHASSDTASSINSGTASSASVCLWPNTLNIRSVIHIPCPAIPMAVSTYALCTVVPPGPSLLLAAESLTMLWWPHCVVRWGSCKERWGSWPLREKKFCRNVCGKEVEPHKERRETQLKATAPQVGADELLRWGRLESYDLWQQNSSWSTSRPAAAQGTGEGKQDASGDSGDPLKPA